MPNPVVITEEDGISIPGLGGVTGLIRYWPACDFEYAAAFEPPEIEVISLKNLGGKDAILPLNGSAQLALINAIEKKLLKMRKE